MQATAKKLGQLSVSTLAKVQETAGVLARPAMLKYLRIAVTALSLTACVLLIALWVRSYWRADRLHWSFAGKQSIAVASKQGLLFLLHYRDVPQPNAWTTGFYTFSTADQQAFPMEEMEDRSTLGFGVLR